MQSAQTCFELAIIDILDGVPILLRKKYPEEEMLELVEDCVQLEEL